MDMIFSLRQLQEECVEQQRSLYITFVDLTKAFDTIGRNRLWKLLPNLDALHTLPTSFVSFTKAWKAASTYVVSYHTNPFNNSVKQGCVLAPALFGLFFTAVLQDTTSGLKAGVFLQMRTDGRLLNFARLRSNRKVRDIIVYELLFADECALVANSLEDLQEITSHFASVAKDFGLIISLEKTEILYKPTPGSSYGEPTVLIDDTCLKPVTKFCYLGSIMSSLASLDLMMSQEPE